MIDIKCKGCGKLLGKAVIFIGAIKCPRGRACGKIFEYHIVTNMHVTSQYEIKSLHIVNEHATTKVESRETNPING